MQAAAINSLSSYASEADAFVIVAPEVVHSTTQKLCDKHSYLRRMWCRAENLCHYLDSGSGHMWMATSPTACTKLCEVTATGGHSDFVQSNLRVFDGEATVASDKLSLVLPVLGLYAGLLVRCQQNKKNQLPALLAALDAKKVAAAGANQTAITVDVIEDRHASGDVTADVRAEAVTSSTTEGGSMLDEGSCTQLMERSTWSSADGDLRGIMALVQSEREAMFPRTTVLPGPNGEEVKHELFGTLIERMETLIANDQEMFQKVVEQALNRESARRRANRVLAAGTVKSKAKLWRQHSKAHVAAGV